MATSYSFLQARSCACVARAVRLLTVAKRIPSVKLQGSNRPDPDYIATKQRDVTPAMRAILVDWMVEVAQEYKLHTETLFQAVGLTDRFLSLRKVPRNQLQLVGVSCMLIASKYEEIYTPQVPHCKSDCEPEPCNQSRYCPKASHSRAYKVCISFQATSLTFRLSVSGRC